MSTASIVTSPKHGAHTIRALILVTGTLMGQGIVVSAPALAEATRAPAPAVKSRIAVDRIAGGLENPWAVQELPDGGFIVTERPGRMRIVSAKGKLSDPVANVPKVYAQGQGGLLDLVLAPDFAETRNIVFTFAEPRGSGQSGTAVAMARLELGVRKPALADVRVIFRQKPDVRSTLHFGSRLAFAADGTLFVALGDRQTLRDSAQQGDTHIGKVIHITSEGRPATAKPHRQGWLPEVWSIGHRNIQGAAIDPATGRLWTVEHGARGGDEINIPGAGRNYGWPVITHGRAYSGAKIGLGTQREGMEQPLYYWDPSIAPSGMAIYTSDRNPAWKNNVFIGALAGSHLTRLVIKQDKVVAEEKLLESMGERIRDVRQSRDGALLILTDEVNGSLYKVAPTQ